MAAADSSCRAPQQIVAELTAIWNKALDLADVGPEQTFLSLGGDSLDAMQILMGVEERFGVALPTSALFDHPTVASLATAVSELLRARQSSPDCTTATCAVTRRAA